MQHVWQPVWAVLGDDTLENRLRHYYWLTLLTPHLYLARFLGLVKEANRQWQTGDREEGRAVGEKYGDPPLL